VKLFGFTIRRVEDEPENRAESFAPPVKDDGAALITSSVVSSYGTALDIEGLIRGEAQLITKYRKMSLDSHMIPGIEEIINEAIVVQENENIVEIDLDEIKGLPPQVADLIVNEFEEILKLLEFQTKGYDIFRRWYIDGRLYFHAIIDKKQIQDGIKELRYVDPRKIKKVREVEKKRANDVNPVSVQRTKAEYYVYNERGYDNSANSYIATAAGATEVGLKIAKDSMIYVTSGLLDESGSTVLSHLHQAIRPLNMLRTMEDSAVIYRLVRAPERRVWYIDVGSLPKQKAEQVVYDMMTRHRNKLVYDPATGAIRDQRKHTTMLEDIWLARREGSRGTEVTTLPGSQNLGQMEEVQYFLRELYKSLHVPLGRLDPELIYTIGRAAEITRDEIKFSKFIDRLRVRFNQLFLDILERQLVLKGVLSPEDWDQIKPLIRFEYTN
jgi:hypothetical protein